MNCPKCSKDKCYIEFDDGTMINAIYKCPDCHKQFFGPISRSDFIRKEIRMDWSKPYE